MSRACLVWCAPWQATKKIGNRGSYGIIKDDLQIRVTRAFVSDSKVVKNTDFGSRDSSSLNNSAICGFFFSLLQLSAMCLSQDGLVKPVAPAGGRENFGSIGICGLPGKSAVV